MKAKIIIIISILCAILIAFSVLESNYVEESQEDKLINETQHLNEWVEHNIDFEFDEIRNLYLEKQDGAVTNILTGYFVINGSDCKNFMFDTITEEMYIRINSEEEDYLLKCFLEENIGYNLEEKKTDMYVYFDRDITLYRNSKYGFGTKESQETGTKSFYSFISYDDYMNLYIEPLRVFQNSNYEVSIDIEVDEDIVNIGWDFADWIFNNKAIENLKVRCSDDSEELRLYIYKGEYKVSYKIINSFEYSSLIQIKVREDMYETITRENKVMDELRDFRKELGEKEYEFDIQVNGKGIDIQTDVSGYYLYFSSTKFLEGQKLYNVKNSEEKNEYIFLELSNGKYPYALTMADRLSPEYFYRNNNFVIQ